MRDLKLVTDLAIREPVFAHIRSFAEFSCVYDFFVQFEGWSKAGEGLNA